MIDAYATRIADTPAAREALRVIFTRAIDDIAPDRLPPEVADACDVLDRESGLGSGGEGAEPGSDREAFDPESVYAAVQEEEGVSFGDFGLGGLLALPRTLSFWKMKARAQRFGEGGGHDLLKALDAGRRPRRPVPPDGTQLRLHRGLGDDGRSGGRASCRARSTP